eukprot:Phypoly_transcript_07409.p1 GENE.Phypoly_transcript_07409~~Phypoly_transcript_07409.p1  ORF type:complete len:343 (+),score=47.32 Phypoly_transcript_07409:75-1103(+)
MTQKGGTKEVTKRREKKVEEEKKEGLVEENKGERRGEGRRVVRPKQPKQGVIDYLCLAIRLLGTGLWLLLFTTFIWCLSPLRPLNFLWRKLGLINNFPLDIAQRWWARGLFRCAGGKAIVETSKKIPTNQPTIMMYSHGSFYDPVAIGSCAPITAKYVFKKELLFLLPFIFVAAWILGHVPINRSKRNSAISSLREAARAVQVHKRSIVIAPEGTRTTDGQLQPFKKGPFHLAMDAGVNHVVPVVVANAFELWPTGQILPLPGTIRIHFLDPVSTKNETVDSLADKVHKAMEVELERIKRLNWHPKPPVTRNIEPSILVILFTCALGLSLWWWYTGQFPLHL